jgi:glycosyltransferase involved in cell wall biosynthesis
MAFLRGWRRRLFQRFWLQWPARRCCLITTISEFSKSEILRYVACPPAKIRVIGVPVGSEFRADRKEFNERCPLVLQLGTQPNKNLERVAEALRGLSCRLRIIGTLSVTQRAALTASGVEYTSVSSLTDADLVEEFRQCDMVVFASTYEGFGMPIVEANAMGRPVVAGNACSMPEVASDAACLVDPLDIESIRTGILSIFRDDVYRDGLVRKGFINARRFTPEAIARQYQQAYIDIHQSVCATYAAAWKHTL